MDGPRTTGGYGPISIRRTAGGYTAGCWFVDPAGRRGRMPADGPTPMAACRRLLEELVVCLSQEHREPITPDTPVAVLAEAWFAELAAAGLGRRPVFPAPVSGGLRDPSNTAAHLHVALEAAGRGELSSHVCRRTVATLMHEAGLPSDAIADQLGHRHSTITRTSYVVTSAVHSGAAEVLAALKLWEAEP